MPKTYTTADAGTLSFVYEVMQHYHPRLCEEKVTVAVLFVGGGLSLHGYPAHAIISINPLKDRVQGKEDCTLELADDYPELKAARRLALVDHELHHLSLVYHTRGAQAGKVKRDDCGRPKLQMRRHDLVVGGFRAIVERHGAAALEVDAINHCGAATAELIERAEVQPANRIDSVTFDLPSQGHSVTLTGEQFAKVAEEVEALRYGAPEEDTQP